jgi:tetrahydromethanopterin S-methyltransferase subunit B
VQRALQEDEGFATAEYSEQVKKMEAYADELIKGMDTAEIITTDVMDEETDPSAEL